MKRYFFGIVFGVLIVCTFSSCFSLLEDYDVDETVTTKSDSNESTLESAAPDTNNVGNLGQYKVEIAGCRLSIDYTGKPVVIVKYIFTNYSKEPASFIWTLDDNVYQDGIGLNPSYFVDDSANYSPDNQTKEIKTGATLEVEVAYELNDTTTPIEVEVKELISWKDTTVTKSFSIN